MGNISINRKSGITWQIICFASLSYCCFFFVVVFPIVRPSAISQDSWSSAHSFVTSIFIPDPYYILSISASLTCRTYLISSSGDSNLRRYCFLVRVYCISSLWSFYVGRRPASGQKVSSVVGHLPQWKGALIFGWKQVERLKSQFSTKCLLKNKSPKSRNNGDICPGSSLKWYLAASSNWLCSFSAYMLLGRANVADCKRLIVLCPPLPGCSFFGRICAYLSTTTGIRGVLTASDLVDNTLLTERAKRERGEGHCVRLLNNRIERARAKVGAAHLMNSFSPQREIFLVLARHHIVVCPCLPSSPPPPPQPFSSSSFFLYSAAAAAIVLPLSPASRTHTHGRACLLTSRPCSCVCPSFLI